ncbi:MAG: hypothetical protein OHK0046_08700 [Anaerolineae bacterium]
MTDYHDLKSRAENLRKNGQFAEAVSLYEQLWHSNVGEPDKWIGWGYAQSLRKVKRFNEALEVCRTVYRMDANFDNNNNLYGWCIYDIAIKQPEENFDETKFFQAAEAIIGLTRQENYSPFERTVFAVVHHFEHYKERKKPVPYQRIIEWLEHLNPELLSMESGTGSDGKSYPSPKEDWYSSFAKALIGLERHQECIEVCTHALATLRKFHYDYDVWFRQYRSESHLALHEGEKALDDLEYMLKRKPDAWIRHRYATALYRVGRLSEAIQYGCQAALPHQRLGYRWEVYLDLGNMLAEAGDSENAAKHILLSAAIRAEEGWERVPRNLQVAFDVFDLSWDNLPRVKQLHRELEPFWKSMQPRPQTTHSGTIIRVHDNGKSGNIQDNDGPRYFFGMKNFKGETAPVEGMPVVYNLRETENSKTGTKELHAVDIFPSSK